MLYVGANDVEEGWEEGYTIEELGGTIQTPEKQLDQGL